MNSVLIRLSRILISGLSVLALGSGGAAVVHAAPGDAPVGTSSAVSLSLDSLGFGRSLAFYGLQAETTISIPVPAGLTPTALTATVDLPPYIQRGAITVIQDDRTVSRTDLPPDRSPIIIALAGAQVIDNALTVRLRVNLIPVLDNCVYDPSNPLRLNGVAVSFGGAETPPATVGEFLPPVLHRLTIFLPGAPSPTESDAAVKLATSVVAHYGSQGTAVSVQPFDGATVPPGPPAAFERQVFIRESQNASVALQPGVGMPSLLISGPPGAIANQVRLLSSDLSRLALSSKAVAGPLATVAQLPTNLTTIRELGQPGVNSTALTNPRVTIPLDQTRLGRVARGLRVHLEGSYTPLPSTIGGQVTVRVGDDVLTRWPADSSGAIDRWVDIPDRLVTRFTNLDVAVEAAGNTGRCGEFQPITLTIDGATEVQSQLADPPSPLGFQSLPQALMPKVLIGMKGPDAFADTVRAVTILTGLQHLSQRPLDSEVVPFDRAAGAELPAVLIAADGWDRKDITLPVSAGATGPITVAGSDGKGGAATLTLDPAQPFGSLQTLYSGSRTLLVATSNGSAAQLDSLLGWLANDVRHWRDLDGTALVAMPGHPPVVVKTDTGQPPPESGGLPAWVPWLGGGVVVVLLGAAGMTVLRGRKAAR
ncbi:hypothetical protein ACJEIK_22810 [Mycobacterium sp. SMC-16]|uniref:hypothetical protein n=1 Tax=Mycobacteriaceae TaxID=1762 RepID=UPI000A62DA0D|nr:hypothetical protein [Mycolicibacterium mucogenicum]MCX8554565.1 hypothetical protein [Mycolicibacterium mucogenicum]